ncbi:hypothetical protein ACIBH1_48725 [Nonomuraea sp. NPDC050663]|uniref:hypothetical protein n=1 Tax=Nonomuraea sp. NPDC050663 TaxID=3364370 RepID=UPI0037AFDE1B
MRFTCTAIWILARTEASDEPLFWHREFLRWASRSTDLDLAARVGRIQDGRAL